MPTFRIILHPSNKNKEGKRAIVLRFTLNRERFYIDLNIKDKLFLTQLADGQIKPTAGISNYKQINAYLRQRLEEAHNIAFQLERKKIPVTYQRFTELFKSEVKNDFVFPYFDYLVQGFEEKGKIGNSSIYQTVSNSLFEFSKRNKNLRFTDIDKRFIENYADYLSNKPVVGKKKTNEKAKRKMTGNGISLYMRTLRSTFNKAIADNLIEASFYPFYNQNNPGGYKATQTETRTRKKALSRDEIRLIKEYEATHYSRKYDAKQFFLFSYYCRGINFTDIAFLKDTNIEKGRLVYSRAKTRNTQLLNLELLPPAIEIIDYFSKHPDTADYLFPILNSEVYDTPKKVKTRINTVMSDVNEDLKLIAAELAIDPDLSTNYARHSWATIMKKSGHSTAMISEGLAHTSEKTTQIYLDGFGNSTLDEASRSILE